MECVELPSRRVGSLLDPERLLIAKTLELPWLNNRSNVSCIPYTVGDEKYTVVKMPPGFGRDYGYFRLTYVKGRSINQMLMMSAILMHPASHPKDLLGCIGCGSRFADLDGDNVPEIVESKLKIKWMYENLPDVFHLQIVKKAP
jgi:hypothetical protein